MASLMMGATTVKRLGPYGQKVCPTLFHYLSSEARPMNLSHTELTEHWSCPLCTMMCSSLLVRSKADPPKH